MHGHFCVSRPPRFDMIVELGERGYARRLQAVNLANPGGG